MESLAFTASQSGTMGVELELQLVNTHDYDLAVGAQDLLRALGKSAIAGGAKPEITQSMMEINSSVHTRWRALHEELVTTRGIIAQQARRMNLAVCGGGAHPFQHWSERRVFPSERFHYLQQQYGYLVKQFTVFGQHVHVGCRDGDEAIYLTHALGRYVPHFIALSAASPFHQAVDTGYDSSRSNIVSAFPLSGVLPWVHSWDAFVEHFNKLARLNVVSSMKDFYWDIRPKPEYGTVEVRVFDTPLTVEHAAALAAYVQALAGYLIAARPFAIGQDQYLLYSVNRFQASRFGLLGEFIDPYDLQRRALHEDVINTLNLLSSYADQLESQPALESLRALCATKQNDATWQRAEYARSKSLPDLVREQANLWLGQRGR